MYEYSFEVLLSTLVYITIFVTLSLVTKTAFASFVFFFSFLVVRKTAGGYHASSYLFCHILFFTTHSLFIILVKCIPTEYIAEISFMQILFSVISILLFAPVAHPNKPFIHNEKRKFRRICFWYSIIALAIGIIGYIYSVNIKQAYFSYSFGILAASIAMLIEKIKQRKETHHEKSIL